MRHVLALGALTVLALACGGLTGEDELPPGEPAPPEPVAEETCEEPSCARVGRDILVRSEAQRLVVSLRGEPTQSFADGKVRAAELDGDARKEILVSRDCGGDACLPDWWLLDCGPGGRCDEAPLMEQQALVRVADGDRGHHQAWGLGAGTITCRQVVRGRAEPCDGWTEVTPPIRLQVKPTQPTGPDADGKVVASVDLDLDEDGRAEHVACSWADRAGQLRCATTLRGAEVELPSAASVGFASTSTDGVVDVVADGRTGRWDGGGWVFAW